MTQITVELRVRSSRLARRAAAVWLFLCAPRPDFDEAAAFARIERLYAKHMIIEMRDVAVQ